MPTASHEARAGVGLCLLRTLRRQERHKHTTLLRGLSDATRRSYDTISGLRWVPMQHHMELSDAIRADVGGGEPNVSFWERSFRDLLQLRLLSGFVKLAQQLPGSTGYIMARRAPDLYSYLFRDVVDVRRIDHEDHTELLITGFPAEHYSLQCFVEGSLGAARSSAAFSSSLSAKVGFVDPKGDFNLLVYP